jgi:hypothetical protein
MNVHHDDNHEPVQPFDEISTRQPWQFVTLGYYLPKISHLHQLHDLLVFKTNHQTSITIWCPLIQRWDDFNYLKDWNSFIMLTKNLLINNLYTTFSNTHGYSKKNHITTRHLVNEISIWSR